MVKIAVDVEGVLADSQRFAKEIPNNKFPPEELNTWGFSNNDRKEIFLTKLTETWKNKWEEIPPVEQNNKYAMKILNDFFTVDIVTARTNADDEIKNWLNYNNVEYNEFISTKTYKEKLEYQIYIDDNPYMANKDIDLYLVDRPWNKSINADNRVNSIMEACSDIILNKKNYL